MNRPVSRQVLGILAAILLNACAPVSQPGVREVGDTQAVSATQMPTGASVTAPIDATTLGTAANPLVIGFVPSAGPEATESGTETVQKLLEAETGLVINHQLARSQAALIEAMAAGHVQVGWLSAFAHVLGHEQYGFTPILVVERNGRTSESGQIVARVDRAVKTLADLAGRTFCRPSALSTGGWIGPSITLQAAGLDPDALGEVIDVGHADNVILAVYNGQCEGGATDADTRDRLAASLPDVKEKVRVIGVTDPIPNDTVAVVAGLPAALTANLTAGLRGLTGTDAGRLALKAVHGADALQRTDEGRYGGFRAVLSTAGVDPADHVP